MELLVARLSKGDLSSAEKIAASMERDSGRSFNKAFANSVVHTCGKAGNTAAAGWAVTWMINRGMQPNVVTFNSVIGACARAKDVHLARKWWAQMLASGEKPNALSYNMMIKVFAEAQDAASAEGWMQAMVDQGLQPCAVSYGTMMHLYGKLSQVDKAEEMYDRMTKDEVKPDVAVFNSLINACAKAGGVHKAEAWFEKLKEHGIMPDVKTYNTLISASAKVNSVKRAEHWFMEMEQVGCKVDEISYGSIIHASAKVGDISRATFWLDRMEQVAGFYPNRVCFDTVIRACLLNQDPHTAWALVQRMLALDLRPHVATYNSIATLFAQAGDQAHTEMVLGVMIAKGRPPDKTTCLALVRAGQAAARRASADKKGADSKAIAASRNAYMAMIKAFAAAGDERSMRHWLTEMFAEKHQLTDDLRYEVTRVIYDPRHGLHCETARRLCWIINNTRTHALEEGPVDDLRGVQGQGRHASTSGDDGQEHILESLGLLFQDPRSIPVPRFARGGPEESLDTEADGAEEEGPRRVPERLYRSGDTQAQGFASAEGWMQDASSSSYSAPARVERPPGLLAKDATQFWPYPEHGLTTEIQYLS